MFPRYTNHTHWYKGPFIFLRGRGKGRGKHHLKIAWPPSQLTSFFHIPILMAIIFFRWSPLNKKKPSVKISTFNILDYSPTPRYCAHYADNICNPHSTESCLLKNTNQKRETSISDLLAMARPERVAFGLSLPSSSSELMNARMISHDSSSPLPPLQSQWHHCHTPQCHFHLFHCCQRLPCCHLVSMSWHFSLLVGQLWEDSSTASMNFLQLLLISHSCLFKCCLSSWWFKYLFSFGTRSF